MTEKDLLLYLKAVQRCEELSSQIKMLETKIRSPQTATYKRTYGTTKSPGEWLASTTDKIDKLKQLHRKAFLTQLNAQFMLRDLQSKLEEEIESELLWLLYHDGLDVRAIARKLNYSYSWVYRARKRILNQIEFFVLRKDETGRLSIEKSS